MLDCFTSQEQAWLTTYSTKWRDAKYPPPSSTVWRPLWAWQCSPVEENRVGKWSIYFGMVNLLPISWVNYFFKCSFAKNSKDCMSYLEEGLPNRIAHPLPKKLRPFLPAGPPHQPQNAWASWVHPALPHWLSRISKRRSIHYYFWPMVMNTLPYSGVLILFHIN
jgi:hypothetical protein